MVCLDVSNSMLAEDVSPNRLDKAKQMLSRLTDGFTNDKVGLIVFAGDAFTQLPITSDYISAKMFLSSINVDGLYARYGDRVPPSTWRPFLYPRTRRPIRRSS